MFKRKSKKGKTYRAVCQCGVDLEITKVQTQEGPRFHIDSERHGNCGGIRVFQESEARDA